MLLSLEIFSIFPALSALYLEPLRAPTTQSGLVQRFLNIPDYRGRVNASKYQATRKALLKVLPKKEPGATQQQILESILRFWPQSLFPNGAKSGWWAKTVQLDLEAKKIIVREHCKPLRWHKL